jgi:maleamate amidohydrolase
MDRRHDAASSGHSTLSDLYMKNGIGQHLQPGLRYAVLVVDFVKGFTQTGYPTGFACDAAVAQTSNLLQVARRAGVPVVFSRIVIDSARQKSCVWATKMPALSCLLPDSDAVALDARLSRQLDEIVITKTAASSFAGTDLGTVLVQNGVDTLIVCGATTSGCVRATVVDACMGGWRAFVPRECVADRAEAPHLANLFDIQSKYGEVIGVEQACQLLRERTA